MKGLFFDILVFISATVWILRLALSGRLSAEETGLFLVGIAVVVGIARSARIGISRLLFRVGLPVASLLTFAISYGNGDRNQIIAILSGVIALIVAMTGFYIMFRGPFKK